MEKSNISIYLIPLAIIIAIVLIVLAIWSQGGDVPQPDPNDNSEISLGSLPLLGDEDAPVTMVEFSDYQCPFCAKFLFETESRLREELVKDGKLKIYWRDFAFEGEKSVNAALAARCADDQGKFWEYHDIIEKGRKC